MSTTHLIIRRALTIVGVVAVLALGVGSIKAAAAWTAASAPLTVAPVSVSILEDKLAAEHARSDALLTQLAELDARSRDLEAALAAAQGRVVADADHAATLEDQLATAKAKLAKLEKAIAKAKRDLRSRQTTTSTTSVTRVSAGSGEHEEEHEDEDEEHEGDD